MWATVVAVAGTLAAGLGAGVLQAHAARVGRSEARRDALLTDARAAVTALVSALADHRRAMWLLGDLRLSGAAKSAVDQAVAASHETRSAVTAPEATVRLLVPALGAAAQRATRAAYAIRNASDPEVLEQLRAAALAASDHLLDNAGVVFTNHQFALPTNTSTSRSRKELS
jgi:hypothetical protein